MKAVFRRLGTFLIPSPAPGKSWSAGNKLAGSGPPSSKTAIPIAFVLCLLIVTSTAARATPPVIPLYHASYAAYRNSLRIGNADFALTRDPAGSYIYQSVTRPAGLVALFVSDVVTETSRFAVENGRLQPLRYAYSHTSDDRKNTESIRFDRHKGLAYGDDNGKRRTLRLPSNVYDRLLAQLAISLDSARNQLAGSYRVLNHNKIRTFNLQRGSPALLHTPAGAYQTIEVSWHDDRHKARVTAFWLAPKLGYLPVRMRQTEPGKATISLVLADIKFDTANSK